MQMEEEALPNFLHHRRITPEQPGPHIVPEHCDDGRPASPDRIAITRAFQPIVGPDPDHRSFLLGERLNRAS